MAGKQVVDKIQLGNNGTPTNNFLLSTFNDGTMRLQRGNDGGSLTDVLTIDANGKITSAYDVAAGQLSLAANGYSKLANGLIIQWGTVSTSASADTVVTYPVAFPNAARSIVGTVGAGTVHITFVTNGTTATSFNCNAISTGGRNAINCSWIAIGY